MSTLGYKHEIRTESHYVDNCKKEETVLHHLAIVKQHLERELRGFSLMQITNNEQATLISKKKLSVDVGYSCMYDGIRIW